MDKFLVVNPETGDLLLWHRSYGNFWYQGSCLESTQDEEWKLKNDIDSFEECLGKCELTEDYIRSNMKIFYEYKDFDEAAKKSKELWDKFYKPLSLYRVAQYFDDIFECYVSEPMCKKDARNLQYKFRENNKRYGVDFGIIAIN